MYVFVRGTPSLLALFLLLQYLWILSLDERGLIFVKLMQCEIRCEIQVKKIRLNANMLYYWSIVFSTLHGYYYASCLSWGNKNECWIGKWMKMNLVSRSHSTSAAAASACPTPSSAWTEASAAQNVCNDVEYCHNYLQQYLSCISK